MATARTEIAIDHVLPRDLREAAADLSIAQARFLVDNYYIWQEQRLRSESQVRALEADKEPCYAIMVMHERMMRLEKEIYHSLDGFSNASALGRWTRSISGIGPVIAAGLLAHIDIEQAPTAGHLWSYAGIVGSDQKPWTKGEKRPWNAKFKTLVCYKLGECFVKVQNHPNDYYGKIFRMRKDREIALNEEGKFASQAADILEQKKMRDNPSRKRYEAGRLPDAHLHARARRYAVKLFLAHYQWVAYELHYKTAPPKPFVIEHLGHVDLLTPPNWPL